MNGQAGTLQRTLLYSRIRELNTRFDLRTDLLVHCGTWQSIVDSLTTKHPLPYAKPNTLPFQFFYYLPQRLTADIG